MMSNKEKRDIDWKTLEDTPILAQRTIDLKVPKPTILLSSNTLVPHCGKRVVIQPDTFMYLGESFEAILYEHEIDPTYYNEVMSSDDVMLWKGAMMAELESMYSNVVQDLVKALEGIKPIGCKQVYKRKIGVNGKVKTYKARLVVKPGFDYEETFLSISMLKPIRILLSIMAHLDYEI